MSGIILPGASEDVTARTLAALNRFEIMRIDSLAAAEFGEAAADQLVDETGVDTGTSTDETYDAAGDYYHNPVPSGAISGGTGVNIGDLTNDGGLVAAFDGITSQTAVNSAAGVVATTNHYIGKDYSASPQQISKAVVHGSSNQGYVSNNENPAMTLTLYGKNGSAPVNATDGTALGSISFTDTADESAGREIASSDTATAWDYVWVHLNASAVSGAASMSMSELIFHAPTSAPNMVLVSQAFAASAAPNIARLVVLVEEVDSVTENTDLIGEVSRDGGTTWSTVTFADQGTAGTKRVLAGDAALSAQPSGTSMKWRLTVANNKRQRIHAVAVIWG